MRGFLMARPKKPNAIRDKSGKSRGEPLMDIIGVALAPRLREVPFNMAVIRNERQEIVGANYLCGFTLGILFCRGEISREQCDTGEAYAKLIRRHASIMGLPMPMPKSADTAM